LSIYEELESITEASSKLKNTINELHVFIERVYSESEDEIRKDLKKFISELEDLNNLLAEFVKVVRVKKELAVRAIRKRETHTWKP
jgi:hypothetical protein